MFTIVHFQNVSDCMLYVGETLKQVPQDLTWQVVKKIFGWKGSQPTSIVDG